MSFKIDTDISYVGDSEIRQGSAKLGRISESDSQIGVTALMPVGQSILLSLGVDWERSSFGLFPRAPLPNTLQTISLPISVDYSVNDQWGLRLSYIPSLGAGENSVRLRNDFFSSALFVAQYKYSSDLTLDFGVIGNFDNQYPVLPAVGAQWQIDKHWHLDALFPQPRLYYDLNPGLSFYGGAQFLGQTCRVDSDFGNSHGRANTGHDLNNAVLSYTEIRSGVGALWHANKFLDADLSAGVMAYREFDFDRAHTRFHSDDPAPYVNLSLSTSF